MKLTPMDIREQTFKKGLLGYNKIEVHAFKELAAGTLEELTRQNYLQEEQLRDMERKLSSHESRETILKEAITSAQQMGEDLKDNARKEAELIVLEAKIQAEGLIKDAHERVSQIQTEIYQLKKQRTAMQTSIRAVLDYHSNLLFNEEAESQRNDEGDDKLKFIHTVRL
jgi:cell division initiation protein